MSALGLVLSKATSVKLLEEASQEISYTFYRGAMRRAVKTMNFKAAEVIKQYLEKAFPTTKGITVVEAPGEYDQVKYPVRLEITVKGSKDVFGFVIGSMKRLGVVLSKSSTADASVVCVAMAKEDADIVQKKLNDAAMYIVKVLPTESKKK